MPAEPEPAPARPALRLVPEESPETRALAPAYALIREIAERLRREDKSGDERERR